jgi:hypothetical protein
MQMGFVNQERLIQKRVKKKDGGSAKGSHPKET